MLQLVMQLANCRLSPLLSYSSVDDKEFLVACKGCGVEDCVSVYALDNGVTATAPLRLRMLFIPCELL
ncbi:hypothetical protein LIER_29793 [Lithospermum erythrorhizon]|uniref:Uncharacterized protein n=1 Tax=Lithospermum erythrorhizon TaxID=34254 RepID=A0AAV3RP06_LITER